MIHDDLRGAYNIIGDILRYRGDIYSNEDMRELIADMKLEDIFSKEYIMQHNIHLPVLFQEVKEYLWTYFLMECGVCGRNIPLDGYEFEKKWEDVGVICGDCVINIQKEIDKYDDKR